jgi:hypothetical protein
MAARIKLASSIGAFQETQVRAAARRMPPVNPLLETKSIKPRLTVELGMKIDATLLF